MKRAHRDVSPAVDTFLWLTEQQEQWLRDSLKDEPAWLRSMVLANFGIYPPSPFGGITVREAMRAFSMLYAPREET